MNLLVALLVALALAVAAAADLWLEARAPIAATSLRIRHQRAQPLPLPPIPEPEDITDLTPDQARAANTARPFEAGPVVPARPFVYAGGAGDRAAALACLTAALLYEAGDDPPGEQAVAQVVLNRLRHPAFPKTVCGVVFQGSERSTGCQFTFTCDGSLVHPPPAKAWARARALADKALAGFVDEAVGTATHYHTDWIVPYWRDSLAKVAQVHTQIFYRWPGWWGSRGALSGTVQPGEQLDPRLVVLAGPLPGAPEAVVALAEAEAAPLPPRSSLDVEGVPKAALKGNIVRLADAGAVQFVLQLDPAAFLGSWAIVGYTICAGKPDCIVMGWTSEADTPRTLPVLPMAMRSMAFTYRKSSVLGTAQPFWDCRRFPRADHSQCLPQ